MIRRRAWLFVPLGVAVAVIACRYVTFDPRAFVAQFEAEVNPLSRGTLDALRKAAGANGEMAAVAEAVASVDVKSLEERVESSRRTMTALRSRYHSGKNACIRYPVRAKSAPEEVDKVADAIIAARLVPKVTDLARARLRWAREEDDKAHAANAADELHAFFTERATAWQRLGAAMKPSGVREGFAVLAGELGPVPAAQAFEFSDEELGRAKALVARYDELVLEGGLRVASRQSRIDLRAPHLRLIEPGLTQDEVRGRIGAPGAIVGPRWSYSKQWTDVVFDSQGHVASVSVTHEAWRNRGRLFAGEASVTSEDEAQIIALLGPATSVEKEATSQVLTYEAGRHRRKLVFAPDLDRVELVSRDDPR